MSPERIDDIGIVHWYDETIGIDAERDFSPGCHFFDPPFQRVHITLGYPADGWHVGYMDPIISQIGGDLVESSPRYELYVDDKYKSVGGILAQWMEVLG
jgi:hypothetical protein